MTIKSITHGRLPNEIVNAHKSAGIKLSPICCDTIKKYKQQLDGALKKRPTTTLKNMTEIIGKSKKDYKISSGSICLLCGTRKIKNSKIGNDRRYNIDIENDIKFLGNNKYKISIPGEKYQLPGVINNSDLNIILEYYPKNGSINYKIPRKSKGIINLNKSNLINSLTVYKDKIAKTKVNFRVQNKDFELILDIPFKTNSTNDSTYNKDKIAA